ncbi:hypothetical protein BDW02DRAFT_594751 [Decorospora gaudefroyi]|uniref:RlpA-like protein double-psi beta-barrel domain-containing protein n=1 Tax=Decorospora gaudefroyi TaxID=184978 RepID=A0A6A5KSP6_9PLEO|nr:hypothetical protein BDW02DRAFT_594751 [Decorospora gaudefroyi]
MIGITPVCLLALTIGFAAGLPHSSEGQDASLFNGAQSFTGDLTFYNPSVGACGLKNTDSDLVVSISKLRFDSQTPGSSPNLNPLCGQKIRAGRIDERTGQPATVEAMIVDRCVGYLVNDIDLSPAAYNVLADLALGRVTVHWDLLG